MRTRPCGFTLYLTHVRYSVKPMMMILPLLNCIETTASIPIRLSVDKVIIHVIYFYREAGSLPRPWSKFKFIKDRECEKEGVYITRMQKGRSNTGRLQHIKTLHFLKFFLICRLVQIQNTFLINKTYNKFVSSLPRQFIFYDAKECWPLTMSNNSNRWSSLLSISSPCISACARHFTWIFRTKLGNRCYYLYYTLYKG